MGDAIQQDVSAARASADVLDDPDDIENRAILSWLRHHPTFQHHRHRYVLVRGTLPLRWRQLAMQIKDRQRALNILQPIIHQPAAMARLRRLADQTAFANDMADKILIDNVVDDIVSGRALLFEDVHRPSVSVHTDPSVYNSINGEFGSNVDFRYLSKWEGNQFLRGYVPFIKGVTAGKSGMTIATGFDIGQISASELNALDIPQETKTKISAFTSLKFTKMTRHQVAEVVAKHGPVPKLTKAEADRIDFLIHRKHLSSAAVSWNTRRKKGVPEFKALPSAWQTVLFSRTFHQGVGMPDTSVAKPFYTAATAGQWSKAVDALNNYGVAQSWYKSRVQQESALLKANLPPPVDETSVPSGAGHTYPSTAPK
jgi:hypothetical protein